MSKGFEGFDVVEILDAVDAVIPAAEGFCDPEDFELVDEDTVEWEGDSFDALNDPIAFFDSEGAEDYFGEDS